VDAKTLAGFRSTVCGVMCSRLIVILLALAVAVPATADNDCVEGFPNGRKIDVSHHLKKEWFLTGSDALNDPSFSAKLKNLYPNSFNGVLVCLKDSSGYITVSTDTEYGPWSDYSVQPPKCFKCEPHHNALIQLSSGTGLHLGQTKNEASHILGIPLTDDVIEIQFNETTKSIFHTESLRLEFKNDTLVRFGIGDYREGT